MGSETCVRVHPVPLRAGVASLACSPADTSGRLAGARQLQGVPTERAAGGVGHAAHVGLPAAAPEGNAIGDDDHLLAEACMPGCAPEA